MPSTPVVYVPGMIAKYLSAQKRSVRAVTTSSDLVAGGLTSKHFASSIHFLNERSPISPSSIEQTKCGFTCRKGLTLWEDTSRSCESLLQKPRWQIAGPKPVRSSMKNSNSNSIAGNVTRVPIVGSWRIRNCQTKLPSYVTIFRRYAKTID